MMRLAWRLALRDMRGGTRGLLIMLACLWVGVASIAGIGSLRAALNQGIAESSRSILGGDVELSTGLTPFPPAVPAWFVKHGARISQTIDTRSILIAPSGRRLLTAARAVGQNWPLLGQVSSSPAGQFATLTRGADGRPGLLLDPTAGRSLGLRPGETVTLGGVPLIYRGSILASPDSLGDTQLFGVKAFVAIAALAGTPLVQPGGLVKFSLQALLPPGVPVRQVISAFRHDFPENPWRLRDLGAAAPALTRFLDQATLFMTLLGLAALLVGGIGVANGVEAWLNTRARSIATLRCLGAPARLVGLIYGLQLLALGLPGILVGLAAGAAAPLLVLPLLRGKLPLPPHLGLYPEPLLLAGVFGLLVGLVFTLPPLHRAAAISGAALFRLPGLPAKMPFSWRLMAAQALAVLALVALAMWSVPSPSLVLGFSVGTILTVLLLRAIAALLMRLLPRLPTPPSTAFAFGLRRLYGPASSLPLMMLSAGAGLTVLVAVAEIRGNLLAEFSDALPASAPSFYFLDLQPDDLPKFEAALRGTGAAHDVQTMPSLRARILAVAGTPVDQFHPPQQSDWPLRSDISFSYAAAPPPGPVLAKGVWWPPNYLGAPLVSFDAGIARDWGLKIGDTLTIDVLGRKFDVKIANLHRIRWQSLQLNFLMIGTPDPFAGAPHTLIATVKADSGRQGAVLAAVTDALPEVTGIDVGQILRTFAGLLREIGAAVSIVGLVVLLAGALVLISATAAEREARIAEAVILKTLGASQSQIRRAWLVEFAVAGGVAGLSAATLGTVAAVATIRQVFHTDWHFEPGMLVTLAGSIGFMMVFGFVFTTHALRQPLAARLRLETGG